MSRPQFIEDLRFAMIFGACQLTASLASAQAPPSAEHPWTIPESVSQRSHILSDATNAVPRKRYDLAALIDLAERTNPNTRAAWEVAREAAAAEGLVESAYLPQISATGAEKPGARRVFRLRYA